MFNTTSLASMPSMENGFVEVKIENNLLQAKSEHAKNGLHGAKSENGLLQVKSEKGFLKNVENGLLKKVKSEINLRHNESSFVSTIFAERQPHVKSGSRLVNKDGTYSIEHVDHPNRTWKHWRNAFQILLEMKWRWVWLFCTISFPLTWAAFALLFYIVATKHGDFDDHSNSSVPFIQCVANANGFLSYFLYSVETQETVGYGFRYTTEECPVLVFLACLQVVFGCVFQACLCAIIWARMLRPKRRGQEVIFSQNACISLNQDNELSLLFRLSDIDGTHLVQSCVRLYVAVKTRVPHTGDFSFKLYHMHMGEENGRDKVLFLWPTVVYHAINKKSPLYGYSKEDFENSDLEFIAVAEGIVESTGLTVQTRTSYLSSEVFWGYKFQPMNFCEKSKKSKVKVQYNEFDTTCAVDTPTCSAKEMDEIKEHMQSVRNFSYSHDLHSIVRIDR